MHLVSSVGQLVLQNVAAGLYPLGKNPRGHPAQRVEPILGEVDKEFRDIHIVTFMDPTCEYLRSFMMATHVSTFRSHFTPNTFLIGNLAWRILFFLALAAKAIVKFL